MQRHSSFYVRCASTTLLCLPLSCGRHGWRSQKGKQPPPPGASSWVLPIPPRLQWTNDHGYCGETSIQSIGLYYGAWLSQEVIRKAAGGETLLGVNAAQALTALHFQYQEWPHEQALPQFQAFMTWVKGHLSRRAPVMIATYLNDMDDPHYDHIVPVVGIKAANGNPAAFDPRDELLLNTNFSTAVLHLAFGSSGLSREECRPERHLDLCVPRERDYGIAVTGFLGAQGQGLPLQVRVDAQDEPNVPQGAATSRMRAHVSVGGLQPGRRYALLRYNSANKFPVVGSAGSWLAGGYDRRIDFVATAGTWDFNDGDAFDSNGSLYYRCVEAGVGK